MGVRSDFWSAIPGRVYMHTFPIRIGFKDHNNYHDLYSIHLLD